ncbi:MAG: SH3 domain-containing protein [Clostridiales bacterium]|jgi:uncharacterized protein YgiM (DUF1202 family)|nr:SH3 domain-containing protein [Clostridiales bacterium]
MIKKIFCLLLTGVFFLSAKPGALAAARREFGQVTAEGVRLRDAASVESNVLFELALNTEVEVLGEDGGWYRVLYNGEVGYVRQDYIFVNSTGSRAAYVLQDDVKLRGGPGANAYVVARLAASQGVKVKQMLGDWYFVVANDNVGYVHRDYLLMTKATNTSSSLLRVGMEGQEVKRVQAELSRRGFLPTADATGTYGSKTRDAVREFQKAAGLAADGTAGAQTLSLLYDRTNTLTKANALATQVKGSVELINWFDGGQDIIKKYSSFTIIDVKTGKSFRARRFGGWYHADSEPLTANDTAVFKSIVGSWTWDRRAMWVKIGNRVIAASMNCMPHLSSPTKTNNFPGHFCVHLYKSKVHENSKECPRHQAMVQSAYRAGR